MFQLLKQTFYYSCIQLPGGSHSVKLASQLLYIDFSEAATPVNDMTGWSAASGQYKHQSFFSGLARILASKKITEEKQQPKTAADIRLYTMADVTQHICTAQSHSK